MKNLMKACVLSVAMLVLMCGVAGADEVFPTKGSALVPITSRYVHPSNFALTRVAISNISGSTVQCKVTMYDQDGEDVTNLIKVHKGEILLSTGINIFQIPPHGTRRFELEHIGSGVRLINGHAVIEWTSDDPMLRKALIAEVARFGEGGTGLAYGGNYLINNGQPF